MKGFIAAAIMLAGLTAPAVGTSFDAIRGVSYFKTVPGQIIVEFPSIGAHDLDNVDVHARFFEELDKRLPNRFIVGKKFASEVFTGASLTLKSIDDVKAVAAMKGVLGVRPVSVYGRPEVTKSELPKLDKPDQFPPNIMTGADKIHATGNIGKGIKVGIIDTGIDYKHPALGGGFGPGFKVAGGHDFVGDNYGPGEPLAPDDDPLDQCNGHGTHVAGIIGADPNNRFNVTGVAHGATLNAYRVFGCSGDSDDAIIIDALIRAYNDGNDVITLSLGAPDGWTTSWSSVVASRISRKGRVVTISAGNSGDAGLWYTSNPGNGIDVISVGSVNNIALSPFYTVTTTVPGLGPFPYRWNGSVEPIAAGNVALPVYATSKDSSVIDDACVELPASTPNLSGYVTLIRRGTCSFSIQIKNANAKGAKIILFYNNGGTWGNIDNVDGYGTAAIVDTASGEAILTALNAGTRFTVSFPQEVTTTLPNFADGGLVSKFSSYGPTFDMYFKPALSAPGGRILSTFPVPLGEYAVLSGTSMACPHTAGIAALILKAKGKSAAAGIRDLLQTTSTYLASSLEGALPQTLAVGGAGLANVYNALTYSTVVAPGQLLLNDTANWKGKQTFWIKNTSKKVKTYTLKHIPAGTALSFTPGRPQQNDGPVPLVKNATTVQLSQSKVVVPPGISLPIIVTIQPPKDIDASLIPVVSGHIEVATADEILKVSYLGAASDLKKARLFDTSGSLLGVPTLLLLDANGKVQKKPTPYTFVGKDHPKLRLRLLFGTPKISVDLVKADANIPTTVRARGLPQSDDWLGGIIEDWFPSLPSKTGTYAMVPIVGKLGVYAYYARNNKGDNQFYDFDVPGVFVDGTAIPVGSYKVLVRALRVGGDAGNQDHYESWLSPVVNVVEP